VPHLALPETAIFAWEARGHGQSPGRRHAAGFATYVRDPRPRGSHYYGAPCATRTDVVIAHSVGAVVAAAGRLRHASSPGPGHAGF
jgi:alpha-beta hydrolase superfamily lysophospholipase